MRETMEPVRDNNKVSNWFNKIPNLIKIILSQKKIKLLDYTMFLSSSQNKIEGRRDSMKIADDQNKNLR